MTAYEVLGVDFNATQEDIDKAFKSLARQYHPDKNNGDNTKMMEINEAYKLIGKPDARKKYDESNANTAMFEMMSTVFGKPTVARDFGKAPTKDPRMKNGTNIKLNVTIPLDIYLSGCEKMPVKFTRMCECLDCGGTGGNRECKCPVCGGYGYVVKDGKKLSCTKCNGTGTIKINSCKTCNGKGFLKKKVSKTIFYRPGVLTETIKGAGNNGLYGGTNGDLVITYKPKAPVGTKFTEDGFIETGLNLNVEDLVLGVTKMVKIGNWSAYITFEPKDMKSIPIVKEIGKFKFRFGVYLEINQNDVNFAQNLRNNRINDLI